VGASGSFAGIPRVVMKHPDFRRLSGGAVKLLLDLAFQYRGKNNGDLTVAYSVLKRRGFNSKGTITRGVGELLEAGMIVQTRQGFFCNPGAKCSLYALSWQPINDCLGKNLDVSPTTTPLRKFSVELNEIYRKPRPEIGHSSDLKKGRDRKRDSKGRYASVQIQGRQTDGS
jgi:hypothetical protein